MRVDGGWCSGDCDGARVQMTVARAVHALSRHPQRYIVARWNWKSAVLSAGVRGAIFFATNLTFGVEAAIRALSVDAVFRFPLVGVYTAVTQAFRTAEPVWAASVTVLVLVPAVAHSIEFVIHWMAGTPAVRLSVLVSIAFSEVSTLFNLFAMRRGVLLVGEDDAGSFGRDLARLPGLIIDFLSLVPAAAVQFVRRSAK